MSDVFHNYELQRQALNQNREQITRTIRVYKFFDKLRSHNVISLEDYEEIDNSSRYPTSAEKAGHLIDVIDTKGPNGLQVFIQCLDDHYPDLYERVTGLASSPRNYVRTPEPVGRVHPFIDIEGVQKLYAQLDELSRLHSQDQLAIAELREEHFKLRFVNTACRAKLSKYPKVVEKQKQMDVEIKVLKEEAFNMVIKNGLLEKENSKLKFERKEHKQLIDQLKQKLEDAVNMHASQKHNWERTNSKNEQLACDKNNLAKQLEHMQREIETVKRQSSLWSNKSFHFSIDNPDQDLPAWIDILKSDKEMLESKNAELVERLYEERNEAERRDIKSEKTRAEYEEFKHLLRVMQKDLSTTDKHYKLTWQELQKVSTERNLAFDERDRSHAEAQESRKDRDRLQLRLNEQLMQFKEHIYGQNMSRDSSFQRSTSDDDLLSPETGGLSRYKQLRVSGYSDTSGMSSDRATYGSDSGNERKSATLPGAARSSVMQSSNGSSQYRRSKSDVRNAESLEEFRPRSTRLQTSSPMGSPLRNGPLFPAEEFQLDANMSGNKDSEMEEERADAAACQGGGCVTPEDVAMNFASRPPHFSDSTRSDKATRGSNRDRDYHKRVDFWIMKQSFRVRPPLNTSFSIDYDDEHEDLQAIFSDDFEAVDDVRKRKKLHRRSRSMDDLTFSSDDSDDLREGDRPSKPKTSQ
ncbi:caspase recruitment domain-containing protein 11-like isoform X2 [Amphiura filiformis]|uniref:caspase recruitment domain-containing protein 11-like isoform X2 n=1 Tax=Amphiura filiformis TaxID=82378 RepID=UPI003B20CD3A